MLQTILNSGIVAIIRGAREEQIDDITKALIDGGIKALEITVEQKGAFKMLEHIADKFSSEVTIGAGTVLDSETARMAIAAGAEFIISPNVNLETIKITKRHGKVIIPGVLTPSEIVLAIESGADAVKIFPAGAMGARYIKEVKGPLSHVKMVATGGITIENAEAFFQAGADGLGVGGSLVNKDFIKRENYDQLTRLAKEFVRVFQHTK